MMEEQFAESVTCDVPDIKPAVERLLKTLEERSR